jgi:hypothetical protein
MRAGMMVIGLTADFTGRPFELAAIGRGSARAATLGAGCGCARGGTV